MLPHLIYFVARKEANHDQQPGKDELSLYYC